eukprot:6763469-Heterocapsa_arctica.AAC.1
MPCSTGLLVRSPRGPCANSKKRASAPCRTAALPTPPAPLYRSRTLLPRHPSLVRGAPARAAG